MSYFDEQQAIIEEKQKIKENNDLQVMNAKKEAEKQKRKKKTEIKQAKYILYDEILKASNNIIDLNELLYNVPLREQIITNATENLFKILNYKYISDELQEDINFYYMDIYNTTATKIISIKTKEKKEIERKEKERQKEEYKKQMLLQYEQIQKENAEKQRQEKEYKKQMLLYWFLFIIFFLFLLFIT